MKNHFFNTILRFSPERACRPKKEHISRNKMNFTTKDQVLLKGNCIERSILN